MKSRFVPLWAIGGALVVVGLWVLSILFVPQIAGYLVAHTPECVNVDAGSEKCVAALSRLGMTGDLFGVVNSLFSGLALGAIALTLWIESRSRRESRKPLVIGSLSAGERVIVRRPVRKNGATFVPFTFPFTLQNQSADAALNVSLRFSLFDARSDLGGESLDGPLMSSSEEKVVVDVELAGAELMSFLNKLTSEEPVNLLVKSAYRSLEGINWETEVVYELRCRSELRDLGLLNAARNGNWEDEANWGLQSEVGIESKVKKNSWDHRLA